MYDVTEQDRPIFYQLDAWHQLGHFSRWTKSFWLEAEVFDKSQGAAIFTEVPSMAPIGDYSDFISGIVFGPSQLDMEASYNFSPRTEGNFRVRIRMKVEDKTDFRLLIDGKEKASWQKRQSQDWEWHEVRFGRGGNSNIARFSASPHQLTLKMRGEGCFVDQILILPE